MVSVVMQVRIGQVFRVGQSKGASTSTIGEISDYLQLTRGCHSTGADIQKGIWAYKDVKEPSTNLKRIPAILLHSNPFKEGTFGTPWVDIIEPDLGYSLYYGDNRKSSQSFLEARGNALLARTQALYSTPKLRKFAPPILLFKQSDVNGNKKGFREFCGYGIPTAYMLVSQRGDKSESAFTNLAIELTLFRLDSENEQFDWKWIDQRRDSKVVVEESLSLAPSAWQAWVNGGETALDWCRRRVSRHKVFSAADQCDIPDNDLQILNNLREYYGSRPHLFEGLASLVAQSVIGQQCKRGWVTKRSGDGGVDFVCRVDLGSGNNSIGVVILGQAKCQKLISGKDLARLAARLKRGWVGVFVTTGIFSNAAQEEMYHDEYPVILINGRRVAREVHQILVREGLTLAELLEKESRWYQDNTRPLDPIRILDHIVFGTTIAPHQEGS